MALALCCVLDIVRLAPTQVTHRLLITFARDKTPADCMEKTSEKAKLIAVAKPLLSNSWFFLIEGSTRDLATLGISVFLQ
jgi:hypothetical protein